MASNGPVVVITGASAGVGRAVTRKFAADGAALALIAREPERLERAADEARRMGARATLALPLDVADAQAVEAAADRIKAELGEIDVWINNAMVTVFGPAHEIDPDEYRRVTDVTYHGTVFGTLAALKKMRPRRRGHVVQVGSALAYRAVPLQAPYCAAKSAMTGFSNAVRSELIHDEVPIELSVVHLPAVNTPQFTWARNKTDRAAMPVPPIFTPEVAADAIHHVAHNPTREYWVARSAYQAILGQKFAPGLADTLASGAVEDQQRDTPSRNRPDNLFDPVKGADTAAEGIFGEDAQSFAPLNIVNKNKGMMTAGALAGTTLLAALALTLRRR